MDPVVVITLIGIAVLGPVFTLLWWKMADKWADAEHRRFKPKHSETPPPQRQVIRGFPKPEPPGQPRG